MSGRDAYYEVRLTPAIRSWLRVEIYRRRRAELRRRQIRDRALFRDDIRESVQGRGHFGGAMTPPAIVIRLPLEGSLQIRPEWLNDSDEARVFDWLEGHPELGELLRHALEVLAETRAA